HGRPGELGLGHLVVVEGALQRDAVAGRDAQPLEPPLVAAEQHVRAGNGALDRGPGAVAVARAHREGLWSDQSAEAAGGRVLVVPMEGIGILHALHPTADVGDGDRLLHRAAAGGNSDPAVHVAGVEVGPALANVGGVHAEPSSAWGSW